MSKKEKQTAYITISGQIVLILAFSFFLYIDITKKDIYKCVFDVIIIVFSYVSILLGIKNLFEES